MFSFISFNIILLNFLSRIGSMDLVLEKFKTDGVSWFVMVLCFCTGLVSVAMPLVESSLTCIGRFSALS